MVVARAEEQEYTDEEPGSRSTPGEEMKTMRMTKTKTGSRRRRSVAVIRGGRLLLRKLPLHEAEDSEVPVSTEKGRDHNSRDG